VRTVTATVVQVTIVPLKYSCAIEQWGCLTIVFQNLGFMKVSKLDQPMCRYTLILITITNYLLSAFAEFIFK